MSSIANFTSSSVFETPSDTRVLILLVENKKIYVDKTALTAKSRVQFLEISGFMLEFLLSYL